MKVLLVGVGAAGNKAVVNAVNMGIIDVNDTMIINSTSKDFPKEYSGNKIIISDENVGCGKERFIAKEYAKKAMKDGKFNLNEKVAEYVTVILVTSVEGGVGSGSTPIIAKMFNKVYTKNVHIIAFTGFEEDVRGLANTVEFFKEVDSSIMVQTISNKSFLKASNGNKLKAEELANKEMMIRLSVLTGQDFIEGSQNIDDTDILKLSNTSGYMTVEKRELDKSLETKDDFNKTIKNMIYNSASITSINPCSARIGIILNITPASEDAIDYEFKSLKSAYGYPFEFFQQVQWDGKKEYIAYIVSGMKMPIDEIEAIYNRYKQQTDKINKNNDEFFNKMNSMSLLEEDNKFNMIKETKDINTMSMEDFFNNN